MNNNNINFLELVKQNPELPIVPIVYNEVCSDNCSFGCGAWGHSEVNEYCLFPMRGGTRFCIKADLKDIEEFIADELRDFQDSLKLSDKDVEKIAHEKTETLKWKKAIIVYIMVPEEMKE